MGAGAVVLAGVVGTALALQTAAGPACAAFAPLAAPPVDGTVHQGKATFYDAQGGGGNCSHVSSPADKMYVALGPSEYSSAAACGGYLDVTGPKGKVRVLIMDRCPECPAGHIDLSKEAFAKIADPVQGIIPVSYRGLVNPPLPGPLTFRMKDGASQYWFAVLVGDHGNPLKSVEAKRSGSGWQAANREEYNYWVIDAGMGPGPYSVRVTDVYGQRAVVDGIRMAPEQTQRSSVNMYGGGSAPNVARSSPKPSPTKAKPTPTPAGTPAGTPTAGAADAASIPATPPAQVPVATGCDT